MVIVPHGQSQTTSFNQPLQIKGTCCGIIAKNDEKWQNSKYKFTQRMDEENVQKWTLWRWSVPTASKCLLKTMHFSVTCSWTAHCSIW